MTDEELGANIRRLRDIKGKTQAELAGAVDSSQKHISRIEKGLTSPTFDLINRICKALKIDLKLLLNFDEKNVFNNIINNDKLDVKEFIAYNRANAHFFRS
jgi:transcriptional regulator with XRE-family HTH domain